MTVQSESTGGKYMDEEKPLLITKQELIHSLGQIKKNGKGLSRKELDSILNKLSAINDKKYNDIQEVINKQKNKKKSLLDKMIKWIFIYNPDYDFLNISFKDYKRIESRDNVYLKMKKISHR